MIHSLQIKMKTKTTKIFLYSIFLITVIPIIIVYIEHSFVEFEASENTKSETKKIKTFSEGILFYGIAWGYIITTLLIIIVPRLSRIPYLVLIIGTIAVTILYYMRIYGIPIPFTEIVITDFSSDWRDVITKICQQILVIPVSILLVLNTRKKEA